MELPYDKALKLFLGFLTSVSSLMYFYKDGTVMPPQLPIGINPVSDPKGRSRQVLYDLVFFGEAGRYCMTWYFGEVGRYCMIWYSLGRQAGIV